MASIIRELTGLEKASVLMLSLSAETSAKVFDHLTPGERELLGTEIVKLRQVDTLTQHRVLDEVNEIVKRGLHSLPYTGSLANGESGAPLKWLEALAPQDVAEMLVGERPQNIALVMAHISPRAAAGIMSSLSEQSRNQVALRLATMKPAAEQAVQAVDEAIRKRYSEQNSDAAVSQRHRMALFSVLGDATARVRESVAGAISRHEKQTPNLSGKDFSSPEELASLPDSDVKALLANVDFEDVCLAMKVASDEARSAVLRNVSEEAGLIIRREMAASSQMRLGDLELAQQRVVDAMRRSGEAAVE